MIMMKSEMDVSGVQMWNIIAVQVLAYVVVFSATLD